MMDRIECNLCQNECGGSGHVPTDKRSRDGYQFIPENDLPRLNYNLSEKEDIRILECPKDDTIMGAFKHFGLV